MSSDRRGLLFQPLRMILPLDWLGDLGQEYVNREILSFVRERRAKSDPGPLFLAEGVCTTPSFDLEIARAELLELLGRRP